MIRLKKPFYSEMKNKCSLLLVLISLAFLLISCSPAKQYQADDQYYYQFTDSTEKTVKLKSKPEKVAILFSSYAQMWTDAGGKISVTVGDSIKRGFADEDTVIVDTGSGHTTINTELLVASEVDLVIGTADYGIQSEVCGFIDSLGIPSALFKVDSFGDYLEVFKIFTDICGTPMRYEQLGTDIKHKIDSLLKTASENPDLFDRNMLFIRAGSSARSTKAKKAEDHFACAMLEELGMHNIADSAPLLYDSLSLEEIIKSDPEYIFISVMGDEEATKSYVDSLFEKDGWSELHAVKEGKVVFLPKELFHYKPNSLWADAYEYLIKIICAE
ncbi:MAG: ABC transporter substrate-binding protein [Clostridia bacterium]|nr:ABC transporter substrate-binding protein [Clostridia bacterium]